MIVTGCGTGSALDARIQEKSAIYAMLQPWARRYIDRGMVATGFTPVMVYMAVGHPTRKEYGEAGEVWVYENYYPPADANFGYHLYDEQPLGNENVVAGRQMEPNPGNGAGGPAPGLRPGGSLSGDRVQSISATGGPQGGSMEPADLPSYTLRILFKDGQVWKISLVTNFR